MTFDAGEQGSGLAGSPDSNRPPARSSEQKAKPERE
jgi:hypothetical protein